MCSDTGGRECRPAIGVRQRNPVVAVATRPAGDLRTLSAADECGLAFRGLLVFLDPPKASAPAALRRLQDLGIDVKVVTGDNPQVSATVCAELGLPSGKPLTGHDVDKASDPDLAALISTSTVFARVSPEQKARIVRVQRESGNCDSLPRRRCERRPGVACSRCGNLRRFGRPMWPKTRPMSSCSKRISTCSRTALSTPPRIFANTMKYVLMGTSSNFGNMFSAAGRLALLTFLPMLPSQILLNNLLYDTSQLTIPTDNVDREQLRQAITSSRCSTWPACASSRIPCRGSSPEQRRLSMVS